MTTHLEPAPRDPARVVLLGARGFIGAALRRRLEAARTPVLAPASAELDLGAAGAAAALEALLRSDDAVVMLSALTPDKGRGVATMIRNLEMMRALCEALAKTGAAHLVYFSSDAVYGLGPTYVNEDTPCAPQDLYGAMHLARELMARELAKIPLLVLRPTLVYGTGDTHNAYGPNRFRRAAAKDGRIALFGEGEETRDHIHVDDVAAIAHEALRRRTTGTLNAATGISTSFRRVAELVAARFERPVAIAGSPRANPVTHRHFDVTNLLKAFPALAFTALADGIARCHREMNEEKP